MSVAHPRNLAIVAALASTLVVRSIPAQEASVYDHATERSIGDYFCGPRAVAYLLGLHGRKAEDLGEIVRECQWPDVEAGSTLASLQKALESRGVHTRAVKLGDGDVLAWPHPVLIHLQPRSGAGHYAVWLPRNASQADHRVWMGLSGTLQGAWADVTPGFTGVALLTSPATIDNIAGAAVPDHKNARERQILLLAYAVAVAAVLLAAALLPKLVRRFKPIPANVS